ncbi:splicing factor, suppressor of white-apricot homolog [Culicoides brevitarsis]|uniref:splicing factor, suppressor of white-apricot homolog n=1 Tax=Culicoides brevitarsis TaxID=469753 RepID=UPI00307C4B0D
MTERRPGGILRRDPVAFQYRETPDNELLVFGYQCKLYRDDAKALYIDQGRHLIPCPSNTSLKVDRFDVRGALSDPVQFEPPPGGFSDRLEGLTPAERKAEELCEEERYYDLFHNDVDEELYQPDTENSNSNGAKIGFNYDGDAATVGPKGPDDEESQDGLEAEPFVLPEGFVVPPDMEVPENMKQHAVIEKTARFIASQGIQMEILLKAKQSNNPQFSFLIHDDRLWPYYKHVLEAIKTKVYPEKKPEAENNENEAARPFESVAPIVNMEQIMEQNSVPVPNYIPSQDCVYFKLMNKIGKVSGITIQPKTAPETKSETNGDAKTPQVQATSGLKGLVAYATDSEDDEEDEPESEKEEKSYNGSIPPSEIQNIIEKVASYVAKNGDEFEEIMANRTKDDPRFAFLAKTNDFHGYYLHKLEALAPHIVKARQIKAKLAASKQNNTPAPVSFSIKPKEDNASAVINAKPVLLHESDHNTESENDEKIPTLPGNIPLTSELKEKLKEARRAKEQIQNKLAQAARERLATPASKEEQLRLERKMKAKAFLDKIQKPTTSMTNPVAQIGPQPVPIAPKIGPMNEEQPASDAESVHSLPDSVSCNTIEILSSGSDDSRRHERRKHRKKDKKEKKSKKSKKRRYSRSRSRSSDSSDSRGGRSRKHRRRSRTRSRSADRRYRRRS